MVQMALRALSKLYFPAQILDMCQPSPYTHKFPEVATNYELHLVRLISMLLSFHEKYSNKHNKSDGFVTPVEGD